MLNTISVFFLLYKYPFSYNRLFSLLHISKVYILPMGGINHRPLGIFAIP
nr:MAG TPA: hypothetical protein [Caudoviricetes sp.]